MKKSKGNWYGKPIEGYNKEELIDIVVQLAKELDRTRTQHTINMKNLISLGER